ncbi:MAG: LolA family protein [Planctomycetota bacterium]
MMTTICLMMLLSVGLLADDASETEEQNGPLKTKQETSSEDSDSPREESSQSASKEELLERVENKLSEIETVQADFVQKKDMAMFTHTMVVKGSLAVRNPGRIAWHVTDPVKYSFVIKGTVLRQWDEDTDSVTKLKLDENPSFKPMFRQLSGWFAGRYGEVRQRYDVDVTGREPVTLLFTPKKDTDLEEIIDHVEVVFRDDERYIRELEVLQADGDKTTFRFHETALNEPIDEAVWDVRQSE